MIILIVFLVIFGLKFKNFAIDTFEKYSQTSFEEEIKSDYYELTEEEQKEITIEEYTQLIKERTMVMELSIGIFITFFITIVEYAPFWIIIIGVCVGSSKYYKSKLSKHDFVKNNEYYREVLKQYSVDLLAYIDNLEMDYTSVLIAMLLQLKLKGIITINNDNIYVKKDADLERLNNTERYIIGNIRNNKLNINNIYEYQKLVINEALNGGLIIESEISKKHLKQEIIYSILFYLVVLIGYILLLKFGNNILNFAGTYSYIQILQLFLFLVMIFLPPIFLVYYPFYLKVKYSTYYMECKSNPYFRTKKSEEINKKLEGLKQFLNDFSMLDQRETKEIILWEEYMIYSVLFKQNTKVIDEYKNIIYISI